jgi:hypothetical protein
MILANTLVTARSRRRYLWTAQLDTILEQGYGKGAAGRRIAVDHIQQVTGWPKQACWDRARKLSLSHKRSYRTRPWTKEEEDYLLNFVGSRSVRLIAQRLKRTESAVRTKLKLMSETDSLLSARVRDGHTKMELSKYLGRSPKTIQSWIDRGWLKGRYEGKQRSDDTLRITDEDFRTFWKNHPSAVPLYTLDQEGLEWFVSVMFDIPLNQTLGDPLARQERRNRKKGVTQSNAPIAEL